MRFIDAERPIDDIKKHNNVSEVKPTWRTKDVITLLEECPHTLPSDPPLTLEELREMDGEPVWVEEPDAILPPFWGLVDARQGTVTGVIYCATFEDYDAEWLAYRRKPEEGET